MLTSAAQSFVSKLPKTMSRSSRLFQASVNTVALRESQWFIQATGNSWPRSRLVGKRFFSSSSGPKASEKVAKNEAIEDTTFLQRFLGPKEMPPRGSFRWYAEMVLLCTVFAITGSSTMVLVRPAMTEILGLQGSLKDGPWSYRICSIVIMTPLYSALLVAVGTIFGRHFYFRHFAVKMFSRFGIPPELMDKSFHKTAKTFRKY